MGFGGHSVICLIGEKCNRPAEMSAHKNHWEIKVLQDPGRKPQAAMGLVQYHRLASPLTTFLITLSSCSLLNQDIDPVQSRMGMIF
jgi:hypothetical protein